MYDKCQAQSLKTQNHISDTVNKSVTKNQHNNRYVLCVFNTS